jgi:hypothetical protein
MLWAIWFGGFAYSLIAGVFDWNPSHTLHDRMFEELNSAMLLIAAYLMVTAERKPRTP